MAYLSNTAINRLNIHTGFHMLAINLAGVFVAPFLMAHGFSMAQTFIALGGTLLARFILRLTIVPAGIRFGMHRTLLIGNILFAVQYLLLSQVRGLNTIFFGYIFFTALADVFYWCSYHAIFAQLGDADHRGKQIGVRQALSTASGFFAPLLGGWGLQHISPLATFGLAAFFQLIAMIPLLALPPIPVARETPPGAFKATRKGAYLFATDGWIASGLAWGWAMLVFSSTRHDFSMFGAVMAIGALVTALGNLGFGKLIDAGKSRWVIFANAVLLALAIGLRAGSGREIGWMFGIAAASSLLDACYVPVFGTVYYNLVQKAPCPLRYTFVTEGAWDIGAISATLLSVLLLSLGAAPGWTIAVALIMVAPQAFLLKKYYSDPAYKTRL